MQTLRYICDMARLSRNISGAAYRQVRMSSMKAWQALAYGGPDVVELSTTLTIPAVRKPTDVLVKVHASSVNPIDVLMLRGYGASMIHNMKRFLNLTLNPQEFPLILGRDFSGTIVSTGSLVKNFKPGDEVFGVIGPEQQGSHAEYVTASACTLSKKPTDLSHVEAASLPYAGLTAWSAICTFGGLSASSAYGKRVVVLGGTGGVGSFAIQLLKAWGAEVTATCATDAAEIVYKLGASHVIDYKLQDVKTELRNMQEFDFVLDTVGGNHDFCLDILKKWKNCKYVTIVSPLLENADQYGLVLGNARSICQILMNTAMSLKDGRSHRWAYIVPNGFALNKICEMANRKEIVPVIDKVFKFEEVPEAYRKALDGHARGKTVIDHIDVQEEMAKPESPPEQGNEGLKARAASQ